MAESYIFPSQKTVATQVENIFDVFLSSNATIRPHFFMTGPSGSGKSHLINVLAAERKIPYFEMNAAQLTVEGVSGNSLSKAIKPVQDYAQQPNICFVDEFDKLMQRNGTETQEYSLGVQDEFLHMLEANETEVFGSYGKYDRVSVANTLFVFAGAFSGKSIQTITDLSKTGIRKEFLGRIPLILHTSKVPFSEMEVIIDRSSLLADYMKMYSDKKPPAKILAEIKDELRKLLAEYDIGLRAIDSIIHQYFINGRYKPTVAVLQQVETRRPKAKLLSK